MSKPDRFVRDMHRKGVAGETPAVVLVNPKHAANVAGVLRAASCWGARQVRFTGDRVADQLERLSRIPREERMKGYAAVELLHDERPLDAFPGATPVLVEVRENAENLTFFEHPEDAVYVFGPEDGSVYRGYANLCHRFVFIPTNHCLNLSQAVNMVLGHRRLHAQWTGKEPPVRLSDTLDEARGFAEVPAIDWDGR